MDSVDDASILNASRIITNSNRVIPNASNLAGMAKSTGKYLLSVNYSACNVRDLLWLRMLDA